MTFCRDRLRSLLASPRHGTTEVEEGTLLAG